MNIFRSVKTRYGTATVEGDSSEQAIRISGVGGRISPREAINLGRAITEVAEEVFRA